LTLFHWVLMMIGVMPVQAATHPPFLPSRDVAVGYQVSGTGMPGAVYQLTYDAADERARIDNPAQGDYFLVDLPAGTAQIVVPALHAVVNTPDLSALTRQVMDADNARFTPLGPGFYAGRGCDKFLVMNAQGSGTACITPDGVILHFAGGDIHGSAVVTATSVSYGPQPPGAFAQPDGFSQITLPPGMMAQLLSGQ
jgi:hypothetical protein